MLRQVEGSKAVADTVACCRPEVICAYPISPQTHIVEGLSALVKSGELTGCEFVNLESDLGRRHGCVLSTGGDLRLSDLAADPHRGGSQCPGEVWRAHRLRVRQR